MLKAGHVLQVGAFKRPESSDIEQYPSFKTTCILILFGDSQSTFQVAYFKSKCRRGKTKWVIGMYFVEEFPTKRSGKPKLELGFCCYNNI